MLLDKWRFHISYDWQVLGDDFDSINSETISEGILQALDFHYSPLDYLKERVLWFVDVTDKLELAIKPKNNG